MFLRWITLLRKYFDGMMTGYFKCWEETKSFWAPCPWFANLKILHPTRSQEFFIIPKIQTTVRQIINLTFCPFLVVWRSSSISAKFNYCLYVHVCKIKPVQALSYVGGNFRFSCYKSRNQISERFLPRRFVPQLVWFVPSHFRLFIFM